MNKILQVLFGENSGWVGGREKVSHTKNYVKINFTHVLGLLLELLDGPLVDTAALVDQMTGGGRLARVDVTNDDNVDMELFLSHFAGC